jgi:hypothetical protein
VDDARRVFDLLEKLNSLFHQPLGYRDIEIVQRFAEQNYQEIKDLYYRVVWEWLPEELRQEIDR